MRRFMTLIIVLVIVSTVAAFLLLRDGGGGGKDPAPSETLKDGRLEGAREMPWGAEVQRVRQTLGKGKKARKALQIYFVGDGSTKAALRDGAERCSLFYLERFDSVTCYAFDSVDALEFAGIDPKTGGMENVCWRAYASIAGSSADTTGIEDGQYADEGCP